MNVFNELSELGDSATLHRYLGWIPKGGHHLPVFDDAETATFIIRPWQSDIPQQDDAGKTGNTPGKKVYAPESLGLSRGDVLVYRNERFELSNPQYDQTFGLERWDARTDDRKFRLLSEMDADEDDVEPPDDKYPRGDG